MVEYLRRSREGGAQHNAGGLFLREMEPRSEVGLFAGNIIKIYRAVERTGLFHLFHSHDCGPAVVASHEDVVIVLNRRTDRRGSEKNTKSSVQAPAETKRVVVA
jgi:hypothetical protein